MRKLQVETARTRWAVVTGGVALALALSVAGCTRDGANAQQTVAGAELPEVLATVGDERITLADVRGRVGGDLDQLDAQYLRARSRIVQAALDETLKERVLDAEARRQGKSIEDLIVAEAGEGLNPSEVEIAAWYEENRARVGGRTLEQVRAQIADHLRTERRTEAEEKLKQRLNTERRVVVHFEPYRQRLDNEGAPSLGTPGAPVTVVEFSDFQCPFCQRFAPALKQLADGFGDQVHVVYRQFPITSIHPQAFKAAEASLCAHEQGKFWQLHDLMFSDQNRLSISELKDKARRVGVDQRRFDACLDSGKFTERVQKDLQEGQRLGVTGTPAVFINGVQMEGGAVPYETLAEAVRRELDRVGSSD